MRLYLHHVGHDGSRRDFPKTVYNTVNISTIENAIPNSISQKFKIIESIYKEFPTKKTNCWGVPSGAKRVISNLVPGDAVFLIATIRLDGEVSALCKIKVYLPVELFDLSFALWGENRYPYIFFFDTVRLSMSWTDLKNDLGYPDNYDPRGKFYSIAAYRPEKFANQSAYYEYAIQQYKL